MALYSYKKDFNTGAVDINKPEKVIEVRPTKQKPVNIWDSASDSYNVLQRAVDASKFTNIIIPLFFISIGFFFIYKHLRPDIKSTIESYNGLLEQGTASPVSDNYLDLSKYISNPAGLAEVSAKAFEANILQEDTQSRDYQGTFYISIPSLGMEHLPVQANVDSTTESSYMNTLNYSLAHFKNTGLPFSNIKNNIVIYGHSASPSYGPKATDPMVAFSFLPNLKVGDDIYLEIEGETYQFKMQRSKIVVPTDTSIITGTYGKRTLTLFTCYPSGNNAQRYVAIAREV